MVDAQDQIERFKEFLEANYLKDIHDLARTGHKALIVDFTELAKFDVSLSEELLNEPEETIHAAKVALEQFDLEDKEMLKVRFFNLPDSQKIKIRNVRSEHLGKFLAIEGIVRQASDVRPQVISAKFECPACGNIITIPQIEQKFKEPSQCSCGRRGRFRLTDKTLVDVQRLILEESAESMEGGEHQKRLALFLREDLVEPKMEKRTTPGSKIKAYGIIREVPIPSKQGGQLTRYDLVVEVNYVDLLEELYEDIAISKEDEIKIQQLAKDPKVYQKFINSIAPSIYGHEDVKGALILQLMGGVRKEKADGTVTRGDIHLLLVGDPGVAKSTMLTFISKASPKSRYVAGRGATSAGITATVVRDEFLKGFALEAGAIVLAGGGVLCLDEMDKMTVEDTSALHEAMEQQQVTITKANIQATLNARTTVLAAANPKLGRFDPYQPIAAQIDLPPTLINRFDLIFPFRDLPNKEMDDRIASQILEKNVQVHEPDVNLDLLRKYVAYVKQNVFPKLTQGAVDEIKKFYVGLRNTETTGDDALKPIPISARQLEALVRLAEGSARIRLSSKVTRSDARKAISVLKHCLMQVGFDYETGQIDIDRISTGVPASTRNKILVVREIIRALEAKGKKTIPIEDVLAEATEKNLTESQVEEIIEKLKREGEVYEPKRGWIARL